MRSVAILGLAACLGVLPASVQAAAGDPAKGKTVFVRCATCHAVAPGKNGLGPTLAGVVGRKAGAVAGFNYSPAMKASGVTWTPAQIDRYVADPKVAMPNNRMMYIGLKNPADRADLIAYLSTLKN